MTRPTCGTCRHALANRPDFLECQVASKAMGQSVRLWNKPHSECALSPSMWRPMQVVPRRIVEQWPG